MEREVGAKVVNGEIIVVDGSKNEKITIKARKNIKLRINNIECEQYKAYEVTSKDKISYKCEKTASYREADVIISEDKMKAFIDIKYMPEREFKLKDKEAFLNLALSTEVVRQKEPDYFTMNEAKKILKENGVVYGIIEGELRNALMGTEDEVLIAEGQAPIKDKPSEIKLFFLPTQMVFPEPDSDEKIDYKNLFRISNVNAGDKIAEIIPETIGEDGMNVLGQVLKREYIRNMPINAKEGCKIENNNIIALIDGKAHIANRNISVNPVYTVESVNMETCNIKFYGDIEVYDSVQDNMFVSSGGALDVSQNVNTSKVVSGGEITILGNALNSNILSGQIDIRKKEYLDVLKEFKDITMEMINYINELNAKGLGFENRNLINVLAEKNITTIQKRALNIITLNIKNKTKRNKLVDYIKENVLGFGISNMSSIDDFYALNKIVDNEIEYYDDHVVIPLDIRLSYCQDCEIKSTGNIIIGGRGEYTSKLIAMRDILFTKSDAVARGGILSAGGNISAGVVGSKANIVTTLMVPLHGKITATLAYENTVLCFGKKKFVLEETYEKMSVHYNSHTREVEINRSAI